MCESGEREREIQRQEAGERGDGRGVRKSGERQVLVCVRVVVDEFIEPKIEHSAVYNYSPVDAYHREG